MKKCAYIRPHGSRGIVRKTALFLAFFAVAAILPLPLAAAPAKAWYAASLEKLGFFVFDEPYELKDFSVATLSGGTYARSAAKGNITLLNFWATWCPPCKAEMPSIEALGKAMKGEKFEIIAVNLGDSKATVQRFLKTSPYTFPIYLDEKNSLSRAFASRGIPTTYLLDKSGKFIAGVVGSIDYNRPEMIAILTELAKK